MTALDAKWRRAFARQAKADRDAYDALCRAPAVAVCQRLHFLQMHFEKLAKAHMFEVGDPKAREKKHKVAAKILPAVIKHEHRLSGGQPLGEDKVRQLRDLLLEIDYLVPAVDDNERRRDNCEYPWPDADGVTVRIPAEEKFSRVHSGLTYGMGIILMKASWTLCNRLAL